MRVAFQDEYRTFLKSTELNITSIISATDAGELFQSSSIACCLLTQGVALGWNLRTPSALVSELYRCLRKSLALGLTTSAASQLGEWLRPTERFISIVTP